MARTRLPWAIAAVSVAAIAVIVVVAGPGGGTRHPAPRAGITAAAVLDPAQYAGYDRIVRGYEVARQMPEVLDGLYCWCDCRHHFDHRSLLTCFESEHAASCDICLDEARMAAELHLQGKSLEEIRHAVDVRFGT